MNNFYVKGKIIVKITLPFIFFLAPKTDTYMETKRYYIGGKEICQSGLKQQERFIKQL